MGDVEVAALNGVSMNINQGEFIAIMGQSGSGKSTLMNILGCLDRPTSGEYVLEDDNVSELDKIDLAIIRNQKIGFVFQSYNLLARTTAMENVSLPLIYDRRIERTDDEIEEMAENVLEMVGLEDGMDHMPHEMSGGQRRRSPSPGLWCNEPVLLLADEPTGNLDSPTQTQNGKEIMDILTRLHQQGSTIVLVTRETEIAEFAERTIKFFDGNIVQE